MGEVVFPIIIGAVLLLEFVARLSSWKPLYEMGPVVFRMDVADAARPLAAPGTVIESTHGVFKLASADQVLAHERFSWFDRYQSGVVVTIDWSSGEAEATGRMSVGFLATFVAFVFMTLLWNVDGLSTVLGLVIVAVVIGFNFFLSRTRGERLVREYRDAMSHA